MKYFLHTIKGIFKNPSQIKIKQIRKGGKNKVGKDLERGFFSFSLGIFFATFFK